jgi:hypothetical protein
MPSKSNSSARDAEQAVLAKSSRQKSTQLRTRSGVVQAYCRFGEHWLPADTEHFFAWKAIDGGLHLGSRCIEDEKLYRAQLREDLKAGKRQAESRAAVPAEMPDVAKATEKPAEKPAPKVKRTPQKAAEKKLPEPVVA